MTIIGTARIGGAGQVLALTAMLVWPEAVPGLAQAPGSSLATAYSANADKPIDIEADSLEVDDKKKIAIFKGNVVVTQGDFNLRSRELIVTYTGGQSKTGNSGTGASSPFGGAASDISRIEAKGKVLVTTKDDQQTTSDWAIFEVKKQLVTIGGDVVLSQGKNVIKGDKLVIELETGVSRFETKERLKAIFTPKSKTQTQTQQ